jgi:hypothetical protein
VALVAALQLGLLAVLDFRDWVHRQVSREAAKVDPSLMVSCSLELSSLYLQEQYYKWMDQIPAVRWQPLAILVADVAFLLSPAISKLEGGCNWRVENGRGWIILTGPALGAIRMALQLAGAYKWSQCVCILKQAWILTSHLALLIMNDACFGAIAPGWSSASETAAFAALFQIANFGMEPFILQHLDLQIGVMALGNVCVLYLGHLRRVGSGELSVSSDPGLLYFRSIAMSLLAVMLVVKCVRYWIAMTQMIIFLRSIRHKRDI